MPAPTHALYLSLLWLCNGSLKYGARLNLNTMNELTIHVRYSDLNEAYLYDVYVKSPEDVLDASHSDAGGQCDGSFDDAVEMASSAAQELIKHSQG